MTLCIHIEYKYKYISTNQLYPKCVRCMFFLNLKIFQYWSKINFVFQFHFLLFNNFRNIQYFPIIRIHIYVFLIYYTKDIQVKSEILLPNIVYKFDIFFHLKVHILVYSIYQFYCLACEPKFSNETVKHQIYLYLSNRKMVET